MKHSVPLLALLAPFLCTSSFAADRYSDAGFPAPEREWAETDYAKASTLIQDKKLPLPSPRNDESAALFWRMANSINFDYLQDKQHPALGRYEIACKLEKSLSAIQVAYSDEAKNGTPLATEIDNLTATRLYLTRHMVLLVEELLPQFHKDRSTFEKNMAALKRMRTGIAAQFSSVEQSLGEEYISKQRSYVMLLSATHDSIRVAKTALKDADRTDLHLRFQKRVAQFENPRIQGLLRQIVQELTPEPAFYREMGMSPPSLWP